jgi:hypothetical protein
MTAGAASARPAPEWDQPVPFAQFDLPPFPTEALPCWIRRFVEAEATATQTPPDLAGLLGLSVCAASIAKRLVVEVRDGWREPTNIFTVTVLPPGNRRSAVFEAATAPLTAFEEAAARQWAQELAAAKAQGDSEHVNELKEQGAPRLIADDCSPERLATLIRNHGGRMAVLSSEGDVFDLMAGRYSRTGAANFGVYLRGHAGDTLRVDRVNRPPEYVRAPALTLGLAVQPYVLRGLMEKPGFRGRGLLGRNVYGLPESLLGRRDLSAPPVPKDVRAAYETGVRTLLQLPVDTDNDGQPQPNVLRLSPEAEQCFRAFEKEIEPQLDPFGDLGAMTDWGGKLVGLVARLAGILHAAEVVGSSAESAKGNGHRPWEVSVSAGTMANAIRLGRYAIPHAKAAYAEMGANAKVEGARYVLAWITKTDTMTFTKREVFNGTRGRFKKVEDLDPVLDLLVDHVYICLRPATDRFASGRKPSPTYDVNPLFAAQNAHFTQNPLSPGNSADSADSAEDAVL